MNSVGVSSYDIADTAISQILHKKKFPYIHYLPNRIGTPNDVHKINIYGREKIKKSDELYHSIKHELLLKLDKMSSSAIQDFDDFYNKLLTSLKRGRTKKTLKKAIKAVKETKEETKPILIHYNKLAWFKDPNLIATIRFHEKLFDVFIQKAEESLDLDFSNKEIINNIRKVKIEKNYLKAIMVIMFEPLLSYGAIYAFLKNDFDYIFCYQNTVSESAEEILNKNPTMKYLFLEQTVS